MTVTLDKLHVKTYESNLRHLAQQRYAKLLNWVQVKNKTSSSDHFPRMAKRGAMATKTASTRVNTPVEDSVYSNRVAIPATRDTAVVIQPDNAAMVLIDPKSAELEAMAAQVGRTMDSLIISAAFSDTIQNEAAEAQEFPAAQKMTTAAISLDYVAEVQELFLGNDIPAEEPKVFVISPNVARQMASLEKATSEDYVNAKALAADGLVRSWMGFDWMVHTGLGVEDTNKRACIAMTRRALAMLMVKPVWVEVAKSPEKSFDLVLYTAFIAGATRVEDEHIVKAMITES